MDEFHGALALAGALVITLGVVSRTLKYSPFSEPMLSLGLGMLAGPQVLGVIDPANWGPTPTVMLVATQITLAISLMGTALRLGHEEIRRLWRPVGLLLTLGMLGMWAASSLVTALWVPLGFWSALLIGAAVTPTDPIVNSTIVSGPLARHCLPKYLRATLSFEAGANDGLAFLFVILPVFILQYAPVEAAGRWLLEGLLLGVILAAGIGAAMGGLAAALLAWARKRRRIEHHSILSYTVALSLTTLGLSMLVGAEALISVFLAGLVFNLASDIGQQHEEESIQEAVGKLFTAPIFLLFGATLPWQAWAEMGWPLAGLAVSLLLFRRLPVFLALWPILARDFAPRDVFFLGWFGPIGIAALLYAADAWRRSGEEVVWTVVSAVVFASILVHGVSASPLTRAYARRSGGDATGRQSSRKEET